jgi:glycosyltransferase involved in cell wall biosynthesis
MSTVDVVIPCYNYARYLSGCVYSVLSQPRVDVRILIIDDASSDETPIVGRALAAADSRITFRRHESNHGHIATYNEGLIGWSTADYTVLLSADDLLSPGCLDRAVSIMDAAPNIGMVYGRTIHFTRESDLPEIAPRGLSFRQWSGADWLKLRCRAGYNVITSPEVVVRGEIQRAAGGYRPELPHAGDLEMWLRIAALSGIAYVNRTPQAFYRVHPESMMRTVYRGSFLDLRQRKAAFDSFFRHDAASIANARDLQNLANRSLAREALWDACRAYDRNEVAACHVEELIDFAMATYPCADSLPEYAALRRRQWLGPAVCNRTQIFAAPALIRKVHRAALKQRWKHQGV